ncbi:hypothetical protein [Roseateles amylovorans]|uniref:Uncharacterized protein n=1 Tax=Roseateles amylovorans TaxID=2978473 RepID=A0ABY6AWC5_9BURK|nr:hypothetical protein [Roseateles amylovorans]UXH76704.1 hypothetical protein N4261_16875 [Roseateles amylovorans]
MTQWVDAHWIEEIDNPLCHSHPCPANAGFHISGGKTADRGHAEKTSSTW